MVEAIADGLAMADHLALKPDDWVARLVFADWLEEGGDDSLAKAQRWMASHERHPVYTTAIPNSPRRAGWVSQVWSDRLDNPPPNSTVTRYRVAVLPTEVFDRLRPKYPRESGMVWACYDTPGEAERSLAEALEGA